MDGDKALFYGVEVLIINMTLIQSGAKILRDMICVIPATEVDFKYFK